MLSNVKIAIRTYRYSLRITMAIRKDVAFDAVNFRLMK